MNTSAKKMSKIIDELVCFFFSIGSDGIKMDLEKQSDGYKLYLKSNYSPDAKKQVHDLYRFLNMTERDEGMEEFFWQLAGASSLGQDSELALLGHMIDHADIQTQGNTVELTIYKKVEHTG